MTLELYHQVGHNYVWNYQSIQDDHAGDGLILSPRHMKKREIQELNPRLARRAVFDPQWFQPHVPKGKLKEYSFFPQITEGGFLTTEFTGELALKKAAGCIEFQAENDFRYVVIPTRFVGGLPADFIDQQQEQFVAPFLEVIRREHLQKPVLLQLVLNEFMLRDADYSADLLNWVTGIAPVSGVYLITQVEHRRKQLRDVELLLGILRFTRALRENDLDVVLGYLNTEALVLTLADPTIVTMGSYEKTRIFNAHDFAADGDRQSPPSPRIYVPRLLQWVDYTYRGAIERAIPTSPSVFEDNQYRALMFEPTFQWHFSKPELYKHHFVEFAKQMRSVATTAGVDRYRTVRGAIERAIQLYDQLEGRVIMDPDSGPDHLRPWLTAAIEFAGEQGWD